MKVLVINWRDMKHPEAGGAEVAIDEILKRKPKSWQIDFVSVRYPGSVESEFYNGYHIIRIPGNSLFNFTFKRFWKKELRFNNYDLIIDVVSKIPLATPAYIKDIPIIAIHYHIHGLSLFSQLFFPMAAYVYFMERIMLKSYTHTPVIVDSESTRKDLLQLDSFQDISVFNLGVELDKIKKYTHIKKAQTPTIIYLGRLKKYKRIDHIIQAVNRLKGDIPNIKLNILGTGDDEKRLTRLVLDLDLNDNISFKGFVTEKQKYEMLTEAWSLVICSEKEGWGLVVIEGNACGTPAIGYDVEGLRDSINNKYSGYLIENANIEKLSTQIRELLENTQERKEISKNAMKWSERFNWDNTAKTFYDLSKRVLKNSKS